MSKIAFGPVKCIPSDGPTAPGRSPENRGAGRKHSDAVVTTAARSVQSPGLGETAAAARRGRWGKPVARAPFFTIVSRAADSRRPKTPNEAKKPIDKRAAARVPTCRVCKP